MSKLAVMDFSKPCLMNNLLPLATLSNMQKNIFQKGVIDPKSKSMGSPSCYKRLAAFFNHQKYTMDIVIFSLLFLMRLFKYCIIKRYEVG